MSSTIIVLYRPLGKLRKLGASAALSAAVCRPDAMYSGGGTVELGVDGTVASAAGPSAALSGVAGTGVT